jgi:hypothetical protein
MSIDIGFYAHKHKIRTLNVLTHLPAQRHLEEAMRARTPSDATYNERACAQCTDPLVAKTFQATKRMSRRGIGPTTANCILF